VVDPWAGAKAAAARHAVETRVRPGLKLALGTGSTAAFAVRAITARFPGEAFDCVSSSLATEELGRSLGLAVRDLRPDDRFDLMLDGADEVSPALDLTKGGGGALFREKFLARLSKELVILVDPSKLVTALGEKAPIPVEVVPFARPVLSRQLRDAGYEVRLRLNPGGQPFLTDNGNQLLDLVPRAPLADPTAVDLDLRSRSGVVETGLFPGLASRVVIGETDGRVEERVRSGPRPA
jgi:ribose 5-phosphate isomerase A